MNEQNTRISYSDLQALGWPDHLINDYQGFKQDVQNLYIPQSGTDADPNGIYEANFNGIYFDTGTPGMWYNPTPGADTGWVQIV